MPQNVGGVVIVWLKNRFNVWQNVILFYDNSVWGILSQFIFLKFHVV